LGEVNNQGLMLAT